MRRNEQPVRDPPVGVARSGQTSDLKLGVREQFPPQFRAVQRMDPARIPSSRSRLRALAASCAAPASTQIRSTRSKASTAPPRSPPASRAQPRSSSAAAAASGRGQVARIAAACSRSGSALEQEASGVCGRSRHGRHPGIEFVPAGGSMSVTAFASSSSPAARAIRTSSGSSAEQCGGLRRCRCTFVPVPYCYSAALLTTFVFTVTVTVAILIAIVTFVVSEAEQAEANLCQSACRGPGQEPAAGDGQQAAGDGRPIQVALSRLGEPVPAYASPSTPSTFSLPNCRPKRTRRGAAGWSPASTRRWRR